MNSWLKIMSLGLIQILETSFIKTISEFGHLVLKVKGVRIRIIVNYRFCEKLGEEVWVDCIPCGGSIFSFTIPTSKPEIILSKFNITFL